MEMLHNHPAHGHRGGLARYRMLNDHDYWPGMHTAKRQVVANCEVCNTRSSRDTFAPYKLRLIQFFQQIYLDFAGPFGPVVMTCPVLNRHNFLDNNIMYYCIFVVLAENVIVGNYFKKQKSPLSLSAVQPVL